MVGRIDGGGFNLDIVLSDRLTARGGGEGDRATFLAGWDGGGVGDYFVGKIEHLDLHRPGVACLAGDEDFDGGF